MRFATAQGRVLVTEDRDFVALSATQRPHAGVVYFPVQLSIGPCIEYREVLALTTNPEEMRDRLLYGKW